MRKEWSHVPKAHTQQQRRGIRTTCLISEFYFLTTVCTTSLPLTAHETRLGLPEVSSLCSLNKTPLLLGPLLS
jgi:hypothetical protein